MVTDERRNPPKGWTTIPLAGLLCLAALFASCGYLYYYAYYIIPEDMSLPETERRWRSEHRVTGKTGLFDVSVSFRLPSVPNKETEDSLGRNRECFVAYIRVYDKDSSRPAVLNGRDWSEINPVPAVDSIVVFSQSGGLREVLTGGEEGDNWKAWTSSPRLCLGRRQKEINITFVATLRDIGDHPLATDSFSIDLVRRENRNWLGLE